MNDPIWPAYLILAILAVMTIQFFRGKWSVLIAGYNTAPKAEQDQYDEKKLCRVMGVCFGIITILLALMILTDGEISPKLMIILIMADILVTLIYANTKCKKK